MKHLIKLILYLSFFFTASNEIIACRCIWEGPFLKVVRNSSLVALVEVKEHTDFGRDFYLAMEVEIIEIYIGEETRNKIKVWGDDGRSCLVYISNFSIGNRYFLALYKNGEEDYHISICGEFWLNCSGSNVTGYIDDESEEPEIKTIDISDFKNMLTNVITSFDNNIIKENLFELYQNYPNPFNSATQLSFNLNKPSYVILKVYDFLGREVSTLINQYLNTDYYSINFDASKLPSSIYFYRIIIDNNIQTKVMTLLR